MANSKTHMTVLAVLILAPDINDLGHVALLSHQKGELVWSHFFFIADFVVHASEW